MNPVVSYIKQTLQGYYPDTELVPMAKLLLTHNKQLTLIKIEILASMLLLCIMVLIGVNVRMIQ